MADKAETPDVGGQAAPIASRPEPPTTSEIDKQKARAWFRKAAETRDKRDYDYAIEAYITGLSFWPEAVEEGHMPLRSLAVQRQQAGGKKPGMMESLKLSMGGRDPRQAMLSAERLLAMDPGNPGYLDAVLKNASRAGFCEVVKFIAPHVLDSLRRDKKPNAGRFKSFREAVVSAAEKADAQGRHALAAFLYEKAVEAVEYLMARSPGDMALRDEQRDLSGRLTITRGKYGEADSFRESLRDAETQKLLHDMERVKQGEQTLDALIAAARREYETNPTVPARINTLVEALLKRERDDEENQAIQVLLKAYQDTSNYSFKERADDVRLRQLTRRAREAQEQAARSGTPEDRELARRALTERLRAELEICRERVRMYPTDLKAKFKLGAALFRAQQFDEAIPILQAAQADPRHRARAQLLIGRCFFEKKQPTQAVEVLSEALAGYELPGDAVSKELLYRLGLACIEAGRVEEARNALGKLVRMDYNYADGDARSRLEALG